MKILGLDPSTKCSGFSIFSDDDLLKHGVIDLSKVKDMEERSKQMILRLSELISTENPDVIICEETWNKNNIETTKSLSFIIGAIMGKCYDNHIEFEKVLPSVWRAKVSLAQGKKKRAELKQEAIDMVEKLYDFHPIEDEAEAILIGLSRVNQDLFE